MEIDQDLGKPIYDTKVQPRQDQDQWKPIHNHSPAMARLRPEEACAKPQPIKGKTKTGERLCINTAKQRDKQDWGSLEKKIEPSKGKTKTDKSLCITIAPQKQAQDRGKPEQNHIPAKSRKRQGEACVQPQPSKGKNKTERSLSTTTAQEKQDQE